MFEVAGAVEIADNAWSTGEAGSGVIEQSLALHSDQGLIVITGCAHPGIVPIIEWAKRLLKADGISLVMVGLGLFAFPEIIDLLIKGRPGIGSVPNRSPISRTCRSATWPLS